VVVFRRPVLRADNFTTFLKSGSLNLLEPSGPVQAYTGIALRLREERKPTRCKNIDDLLSIVDVDY